jgi:hypothetical protein
MSRVNQVEHVVFVKLIYHIKCVSTLSLSCDDRIRINTNILKRWMFYHLLQSMTKLIENDAYLKIDVFEVYIRQSNNLLSFTRMYA